MEMIAVVKRYFTHTTYPFGKSKDFRHMFTHTILAVEPLQIQYISRLHDNAQLIN